ncbi:cytochrome c oxidase subunit 2A [Planococcus lenghuensis]|uniref:cytochrome c oxidase subunit 2A n=1 Tax=Planococcus lenghuensis TaxID=2213202 RepID=UPI0012ECA5A2|nr:cytochrome c oxidase subunit 2A [Planococcus lenghuensis]
MSKSIRKQLGIDRHSTAEEYSLKGTFVSVLILAAVMIVSWFGIMVLFLDRL